MLSIFGTASALLQAQEQKSLTDIQMDSAISSHQVILYGKGAEPSQDSIKATISKFYEDQFRHSQDPLAPYFLFMSKDANLAMGIGGVVRMRGYYDWGGSIPSPGFAPYLIPMSSNPANQRSFATTPAGTALFFRVIGRNKKLGDYQLYIEANFNGYKARDFHLKKAYGVINDWTIGYANSSFSDPAALPPAVDASGPNAKMSATDVLVRWAHNFKKGFSMGVSVETPTSQIQSVAGQSEAVTEFVPDLAAYGQYQWGKSEHIRLSAIYRSLPYRDLVSSKNYNTAGWGLQASTTFHPIRQITLYGAFNLGHGYSSLGGDWLMGNYDLVPDPNKAGRLYSPFCYGGYGAVQYNFTPDVFISGTFGGTRYAPKYAVDPTEYKQGLYMAANVFWYLTARISCAAEIDFGRRLNFDGRTAWARRVGAFVQFSF